MADKMMRISGRSNDGVAKPVKVFHDGRLITKREFEETILLDGVLIPANSSKNYSITTHHYKNMVLYSEVDKEGRYLIDGRPITFAGANTIYDASQVMHFIETDVLKKTTGVIPVSYHRINISVRNLSNEDMTFNVTVRGENL